jgi:coenzyme F420-0:L-glutamate ligase
MTIKAIKTGIFLENEKILPFIFKYIKRIPNNSVLVVTSKIVALSEGRMVEYKNQRQKIKLIKQESDFALKTKYTWLSIKDGMVMANAGIDESNADGKMILLPRDSFESASYIRSALRKKFGIKNLGVLITDSRLFPLRAGIVGVALGYAGFKGTRNYIGKKDIFGRVLKMSKTDIADSLAASAVLCMGEGKERQPLAVITNAPVIFAKKIERQELIIDPKEDMYEPFFTNLKILSDKKNAKNK